MQGKCLVFYLKVYVNSIGLACVLLNTLNNRSFRQQIIMYGYIRERVVKITWSFFSSKTF